MIDTHAHLDFEEFDQDREEVISRAFDNGVKAIINVGVDLERNRRSIEIADKHKGVFAAVGLHPDYFVNYELGIRNYERDFDELKKLARQGKVVAIGETGLDYHRVTCNVKRETQKLEKIKEKQKTGFITQVKLAKKLGLPVIVHCRDAWEDLYEIISNFKFSARGGSASGGQVSNQIQNPESKKIQNTRYKIQDTKFVLHCYSGEKEDTEKFLRLPNVYFSFSGNITYPKPADRADMLAEAVRMVPLDKIMLDSDAPFLAPQTFRGKRNEPAYVRCIAQKIAQIKGISGDEVEWVTDANARRFFGI